MKQKKQKKLVQNNRRFSALLSGLVLSGGFFVLSWVTAEEILPGVTIAGVHVSGMKGAAAEQAVQSAVSNRIYTLEYGTRAWQVTPVDLGLSYDVRGAVSQARSIHRTSNVVAGMVQIEPKVSVDRNVLEAYLRAIAETTLAGPRNATFTFFNGAFEVSPDQAGLAFDVDATANALTSMRTVDLSVTREVATITTVDANHLLPDVASFVDRSANVIINAKHFSISPEVIRSWLTIEKDKAVANVVAAVGDIDLSPPAARLGLDKDKVRDWLRDIGESVEEDPVAQQVLKGTQRVEVVVDGKPGKQLVLGDAVEQVTTSILSGNNSVVTLALTEVPRPIQYIDPPASPIASGKVIAVDLTKQHAYLFEDSSLVYSMKISSGINDWTPTGTFHVYGKTKKQKMSGPGYYVPNVPNILWFKGDYSLHGVYWHNDFGIRPRSHGCVGQSVTDSAFSYDWAQVGTPVVIYKS